MQKKFFITVTVILIIFASYYVWGKIYRSTESIRCSISLAPKTLDPRLMDSLAEGHIARQIYEGLTILDDQLMPQPAVAESWEILDGGTKYIFHLRKEARWSNGDPVTAYDFEYAWKTALDPELLAKNVNMMFCLKNAKRLYAGEAKNGDLGVRAIDAERLEVILEYPLSYFPAMLASTTFYPLHKSTVASNSRWAVSTDTVVCNGAYMVGAWDLSGRETVLLKNKYYRGADKVRLERLSFVCVEDADERVKLWKDGKLDIIQGLSIADESKLQSMGVVKRYSLLGTYFYFFNTLKPPFDNIAVRQAVADAVNRVDIAKNAGLLQEQMAVSLVPFSLMKMGLKEENEKALKDEGVYLSAGNMKEAEKTLLAAGLYRNNKVPEFAIIYNEDKMNSAVTNTMAKTLKDGLGLKDVAKPQSWREIVAALNKGEFQMAKGTWVADYAEPIAILEIFSAHSENNYTGWKNSHFEELLDRARKTEDVNERRKCLLEAENILLEEAVVVPILFYQQTIALKNGLENVRVNAMDYIYYKDVYWRH